jgi:ATP-dependent DNA helicase RecG
MLALAIKVEEQQRYLQNLTAKPIKVNSKLSNQFIKSLPYELTNDQNQAVEKILEEINSDKPSNILLNGDVGSGKTVVAAIAILNAISNGNSAILIAPTTVLANQHYQTFLEIFKDFNIDIDLCISSKKIMSNADNKLIIGTHAILFQKELPQDLNLIIIDEQHRFGVEQREHFRNTKGESPHYISMTATPIPRSLTEIFFGNLEVLEIREKPSIRKEIETYYTPYPKRKDCFKWVQEKILESNNEEQAFIIYPLIEDSENYTAKSVLTEYENLKEKDLNKLKVEFLHGKLKASEKTELLERFKNKEFDVLVSTSVIEVGIDIPNATIMVIEDAERFGLAQLHQLRGRIGRSDKQSYCYIIPGQEVEKDSEQQERLKYFASHSSGFDVADYDLQTRGPGEVYGNLQSGVLQFKVASIHDIPTLRKARKVAKQLVKEDNSHRNILENLFR